MKTANEKNSNNKIKAVKNSTVRVGDGLDEKETAELVGEKLDEKLEPISQTIFDTANTVESAGKNVAYLSKFAEDIEARKEKNYYEHLESGWNYLCSGKFDGAMFSFSEALRCNASGHEAHFGFALAAHRIQLLDIGGGKSNADSFNKIPIYCEIDGDLYLDNSFEKDSHYKLAEKYSESVPEIQKKYIDCAKKIKDIIRAFHGYCDRKYDCFICAKVTELDKAGNPITGKRTEDCVWAIGLHKKLKKEGLNPFFSECDIEGQAEIAGTEYEALILYALIHSKCMVIVCSDQKYFTNSVFMQNEYRRFCAFLNTDGRKADNIYLVRKDAAITLPHRGETQDCIRKGNDKDYKNVIQYVSLKVRGESIDSSLKKYCPKCEEGHDKTYQWCPNCGSALVDFDEYEAIRLEKLDNEIKNKTTETEQRLNKAEELRRRNEEESKRLQAEKEKARKTQQEYEEMNRKAQEELLRKQQELAAAAEKKIAEERKKLEEERSFLQEEKKSKVETVLTKEDLNTDEVIKLAPLEDVQIPENCSKEMRRLYKSAKRGNNTAQYDLGLKYYENKDYEQAKLWFYRSAQSGDVDAQYMLGLCYYNEAQEAASLAYYGKKDTISADSEWNYKQAVKWYLLAAEKGSAYAQNNLGICYENGTGVEIDSKKAVAWYKKSAKQGDKTACENLAICYRNGVGVEVDTQEAAKWDRRPSMQKLQTIIKWSGVLTIAVIGVVLCLIFAVLFGEEPKFPSTSGYIWISILCLFGSCFVFIITDFALIIYRKGFRNWIHQFSTYCAFMILFLIISFLIMFGVVTPCETGIKNYDFEYDGALYSIQEDNTLSVSNAEMNVKKVKIPEEIEGYRVTSIDQYAFSGCSKLISIAIPNSVTSIYFYISSCNELKDITYNGSKEEWITVARDVSWWKKCTIHCTDGDINKE